MPAQPRISASQIFHKFIIADRGPKLKQGGQLAFQGTPCQFAHEKKHGCLFRGTTESSWSQQRAPKDQPREPNMA